MRSLTIVRTEKEEIVNSREDGAVNDSLTLGETRIAKLQFASIILIPYNSQKIPKFKEKPPLAYDFRPDIAARL
jgi:hypothetical protein